MWLQEVISIAEITAQLGCRCCGFEEPAALDADVDFQEAAWRPHKGQRHHEGQAEEACAPASLQKSQAAEEGRHSLVEDFCEDKPACPPEGAGPPLKGGCKEATADHTHGEEAPQV